MSKRLLFTFLLLSAPLVGQLWNGYIPASRAARWEDGVGATGNGNGGLCASATIYKTLNAADYGNGTLNASADVNAFLAAAPTGQQVKLGAGTFLITGQIVVPNNGILCGSGADTTTLDVRSTVTPAISAASSAGSYLVWYQSNAWSSQLMNQTAQGSYSGSLSASCNNGGLGLNNGQGPSMSKGSNCFGVGSTAFFTVKSSTAAPGALGQPQGVAELSMVDDCNANATGGVNPSGCIATSTGTQGTCNNCDQFEQKAWYGVYPNTACTGNACYWLAGKTYHANDYALDFSQNASYIWQVFSVQGSGVAGSTNPFPAISNSPVFDSTTVTDCNPSPCTGSDTNVITWIVRANATRSQGQLTKVTGVDATNNVIVVETPLLFDYTAARIPHATPMPLIQNVTIGDFEFYLDAENGATTNQNIVINGCYNCTIRGVFGNYTIYEHAGIQWCLKCSVINNYFSNAYRHNSGALGEGGVSVLAKSTSWLVANNTIERVHNALAWEWGSSFGVAAYNYTTGNFHIDRGTTQQDFANHGSAPAMILVEGNKGAAAGEDNTWGNHLWVSFFRNWITATNLLCIPYTFAFGSPPYNNPSINTPRAGVNGEPPVTCTPGPGSAWFTGNWPTSPPYVSPNGWNSWQSFHGNYGMNVGPEMYQINILDNVVGSLEATKLYDYTDSQQPALGTQLPWTARTWTLCGATGAPSPSSTNRIKCGPSSRSYSGGGAYGYTFGYPSSASDTGGGTLSSLNSWNQVIIDHDFSFFDYYCLTNTAGPCASDTSNGVWSHNPNQATDTFPASFWLSSQPTWAVIGFDWPTTIPWPSIGSDVTSASFASTTTKGDPNYNYHVPAGCSMPAECVFMKLNGQAGGAGSPVAGFNENLYNSGIVTHTLSITSAHGSVLCNGTTCASAYVAGTVVSMSITPTSGFAVSSWTGADSVCTGQTSCTVTMNTDAAVTINFTSTTAYNLVITAANGSVSPTPPGVSCGANCYQFASGTPVTLLASPTAGYQFTDWTVTSGTCTGTTNPCLVTMSGNVSVTANFTSAPPSTLPQINGSVRVQGGVTIH